MGFTDVAWESRDTEQLARDLTDGAGPMPVGQAGAAWVRVANELANVSNDYQMEAQRLSSVFNSQSATSAARKIDDFGRWLQALALNAAANGERAEEAAVANGSAVLAMPSVPEVVEARAERDMMNSLAAYNGAILDGHFADLDEAAVAGQAQAADVMYRYEESCAALASPWDQPMPPDATNGSALQAERATGDEGQPHEANGGSAAHGARGGAVVSPPPLAPFRTPDVKSTVGPKSVQAASASAAGVSANGGMGGVGGGYGPMAMAGRGDDSRQHESSIVAGSLVGGGEPIAGVSGAGAAWLPAAQPTNDPRWVADVSWSADASMVDSPIPSDQSAPHQEPGVTLHPGSDRWRSPSVTGADWWTRQ